MKDLTHSSLPYNLIFFIWSLLINSSDTKSASTELCPSPSEKHGEHELKSPGIGSNCLAAGLPLQATSGVKRLPSHPHSCGRVETSLAVGEISPRTLSWSLQSLRTFGLDGTESRSCEWHNVTPVICQTVIIPGRRSQSWFPGRQT